MQHRNGKHMARPHRWRPVLAVAVFVSFMGVTGVAQETGDNPDTVYFYAPHGRLEAYRVDSKAFVRREPKLQKVLTTPTIAFDISYEDEDGVGFFDAQDGPQRRARLEDALTYVAAVINMPGDLDVRVDESQNEQSGALAAAGTFYSTVAGFTNGSAFARLDTGRKPFSNFPEITLVVNFGYKWNIETRAPAGDEFDFLTVLVHEITHGLGFASLASESGESLIMPEDSENSGIYTKFDELMVYRTGERALFGGDPPDFLGSSVDLRSDNLAMSGSAAFTEYDQGVLPGIYAPDPFQRGSSLSHWDTNNIVGGAIMEHAFAPGVERRSYAPIDIGALIDLGYTNAAPAPPPGGDDEEEEPEGAVDVNSVVQVTVRDSAVGVAITDASLRLDPTGETTNNNDDGQYTFNVLEAGTYKVSANAPGYRAIQSPTFDIDGDTPQVNMPLSMEAFPEPAIRVSPAGDSDFGTVNVDSSDEIAFSVTNTGGGRLSGTASVSGSGFTSIGNDSYLLAQDTAAATITVRFAPTAAQEYTGTVTFTGGGGASIGLSGSGEEPEPPPEECGTAALDSANPPWGNVALLLTVATLLVWASRYHRVPRRAPAAASGKGPRPAVGLVQTKR
ncbi:MAG: carboxypeptidase regulatory-like domain-containing protein [Candidatus Hydrogenedentota bacterium]